MADFAFTEILPLGDDTTEYRLIGTEGVSQVETPLGTFLKVEPEAITLLTQTAMRDSAHLRDFALSALTSREEVAHIETHLIFAFQRAPELPVYAAGEDD